MMITSNKILGGNSKWYIIAIICYLKDKYTSCNNVFFEIILLLISKHTLSTTDKILLIVNYHINFTFLRILHHVLFSCWTLACPCVRVRPRGNLGFNSSTSRWLCSSHNFLIFTLHAALVVEFISSGLFSLYRVAVYYLGIFILSEL